MFTFQRGLAVIIANLLLQYLVCRYHCYQQISGIQRTVWCNLNFDLCDKNQNCWSAFIDFCHEYHIQPVAMDSGSPTLYCYNNLYSLIGHFCVFRDVQPLSLQCVQLMLVTTCLITCLLPTFRSQKPSNNIYLHVDDFYQLRWDETDVKLHEHFTLRNLEQVDADHANTLCSCLMGCDYGRLTLIDVYFVNSGYALYQFEHLSIR
jgi:hypothetical protein